MLAGLRIRLAIPRQRRIVRMTSVRLEFGPDSSLECPHAPSPSLNTERQISRDYGNEFSFYQQPTLAHPRSAQYMRAREKQKQIPISIS